MVQLMENLYFYCIIFNRNCLAAVFCSVFRLWFYPIKLKLHKDAFTFKNLLHFCFFGLFFLYFWPEMHKSPVSSLVTHSRIRMCRLILSLFAFLDFRDKDSEEKSENAETERRLEKLICFRILLFILSSMFQETRLNVFTLFFVWFQFQCLLSAGSELVERINRL